MIVFAGRINKSVRIRVSYRAEDLVKAGRKGSWKKSKLHEKKGNLDLIKLLEAYFVHLSQDYGKMVATELCPDLEPAYNFYLSLTNEVRQKYPSYRMIFARIQTTPPNKWSIRGSNPPNNVFEELGIIRG